MKDTRSSTTYNIPLHIWLNFKIFCTNWSLKSIDHCYWINVYLFGVLYVEYWFRWIFYLYKLLRCNVIQYVVQSSDTKVDLNTILSSYFQYQTIFSDQFKRDILIMSSDLLPSLQSFPSTIETTIAWTNLVAQYTNISCIF